MTEDKKNKKDNLFATRNGILGKFSDILSEDHTAVSHTGEKDKLSEQKLQFHTWRDVPVPILNLLDSYPYDENFNATIASIKEGKTVSERIRGYSDKLQMGYLSNALYLFIHRDYKRALQKITVANRYYFFIRIMRNTKMIERGRIVYFYTGILRATILFIMKSYKKSYKKLRACLAVDSSNGAIVEFMNDLKSRMKT